eukprot:UN08945
MCLLRVSNYFPLVRFQEDFLDTSPFNEIPFHVKSFFNKSNRGVGEKK